MVKATSTKSGGGRKRKSGLQAFIAARLAWAEHLHGRLWSTLARVAEQGAGEGVGAGFSARLARLLRTLVLSILSFTVNEVPVRAAALSFTTLLAFIPLTIILSSVAGWLGYLDLLTRLIPYFMSSLNLDLPLDPVLEGLQRAEGISFHQLGLLGSVFLIVGFYFSMSSIEEAMNRVWNVRVHRGWMGRFRRYTPFLMLLAGLMVVTVILLFRVRRVLERWGWGRDLSFHIPGSEFLFNSSSLLVFLGVLIFFMIRLLPNTPVPRRSALLGALSATALLYLLSRFLLLFPAIFLERNQIFYGSLVVFPVALLLIYAFWITVLFGSTVAFVHGRLQNQEGQRFFARKSSGFVKDWTEALRETHALYARTSPVEDRPGPAS
jgi:membrane protein